jgi:hypothetical protein
MPPLRTSRVLSLIYVSCRLLRYVQARHVALLVLFAVGTAMAT